eukprot:8992367-Pyramimonas_sp.AAC.1
MHGLCPCVRTRHDPCFRPIRSRPASISREENSRATCLEIGDVPSWGASSEGPWMCKGSSR